MKITRDQFIRGFNAIQRHHDGVDSITQAAIAAGWKDTIIGSDPIADELQAQLEERCNDTFDDPEVGTFIHFTLYETGMCGTPDGSFTIRLEDAESLWTWWEKSRTGPFQDEVEA